MIGRAGGGRGRKEGYCRKKQQKGGVDGDGRSDQGDQPPLLLQEGTQPARNLGIHARALSSMENMTISNVDVLPYASRTFRDNFMAAEVP
jgi:hypothetical protein